MKIRTLIVAILGVLLVSSVSPAQDEDVPQLELEEPVAQESSSPEVKSGYLSEQQRLAQTLARAARSASQQRLAQDRVRAARSASARQLDKPPATRTVTASTTQSIRQPGSPPRAQTSRPTRRLSTPPKFPTPTAPKNQTEVRIFQLKHTDLRELANLIGSLFRATVHEDERLNRLVVSATPEQLKSIMSLIEEMDVGSPEASTPRGVQNLVYRIYMFEIPSGDEDLKPFSMTLRTSLHVSLQELMNAATDEDLQVSEIVQKDLQISEIVQGKIALGEKETQILIRGRAASNGSLKLMVDRFPDSQIVELKWDDAETFTDKIKAAQYAQLPDQMQKHIARFLGSDMRTVGYWFGNLSVPGKIDAPVGPWELSMSLAAESDRMLEIGISVVIPGQIQSSKTGGERSQSYQILSNIIRTKIGKPIIIGYNRDSYGTRKMGAMVIIPEADTFQSDNAETKTF